MNIPVNEMTVSEKLQALSIIWDSLSEDPDSIPAPKWQREELEKRAQRLESGEATVSDWDEAEKRFDQLGS